MAETVLSKEQLDNERRLLTYGLIARHDVYRQIKELSQNVMIVPCLNSMMIDL